MKIPWNVKKKKTVPGPTYAGLGKLQLSLLPPTSPHTKPINPWLRGPCKVPPFQKPGPQTSRSGVERWPLRLILEERQIAYVLTCKLLMAVFTAAAFPCCPRGLCCESRHHPMVLPVDLEDLLTTFHDSEFPTHCLPCSERKHVEEVRL